METSAVLADAEDRVVDEAVAELERRHTSDQASTPEMSRRHLRDLFELVVSLAVYGKAWGFVSLGSGRAAVGAPWLRIAMSILSAGVTSAYAVWLIGRRRQTLGMQAVGITVIDPSGRALTRRQVWLRGLYWLLFVELAFVDVDHEGNRLFLLVVGGLGNRAKVDVAQLAVSLLQVFQALAH